MSIEISRSEFINTLNALAKEYDILCPVLHDDRIKISEFDGKNIDTIDRLPLDSLKQIVLPQREFLVKYTRQENKSFKGEEVRTDDRKKIVFSKPCDANALNFLDNIFPVDKIDIYYKRRRENLLVISTACTSPCRTCFCTMTGYGPFNEIGSDIICMIEGDHFYLKPVTEKGRGLIKKIKGRDTTSDLFEKAKEKAEAAMGRDSVDINELKNKTYKKFEDDIWKELGSGCLGCGVCTFMCPTCYCFDIDEEASGCDRGVRVRNWDSCQFALFTLHATGHNPRPTQTERMRQRFEHKLSYIPQKNNLIGCVGCGRCVASCPVNIDIREVITYMLEKKDG